MVFDTLIRYLGLEGERQREPVAEENFYCIEYSPKNNLIRLFGKYDLATKNSNCKNLIKNEIVSILRDSPSVEVDATNIEGNDTCTAAFFVELLGESGLRSMNVKMGQGLEDRCKLSGFVGSRIVIPSRQ